MAFRFKYTFKYCGNGVHQLTILEQDEKIPSGPVYTCKNGWRIRRSSYPEISVTERIIYLKGKKNNLSVASAKLKLTTAAEVLEALQEFSARCCGGRIQHHRLTSMFMQ